MHLEKKLKQAISGLKEDELQRVAQIYARRVGSELSHQIKSISFNCYESMCTLQAVTVNGYGKNANEALQAGLYSLFELLLSHDKNQIAMREVLGGNGHVCSQKKVSLNLQKACIDAQIQNGCDAPVPRRHSTLQSELFDSVKSKGLPSSEGVKLKSKGTINHAYASRTNLNSEHVSVSSNEKKLELAYARIKELENDLASALKQNKELKESYTALSKSKAQTASGFCSEVTQATKYESRNPAPMMNNFLNDISNQMPSELQDKNRVRSQSVSQNNPIPSSTQKIKIPKLNLQILPNYHGKSNKSLNQSLLENYEKKFKVEA